MLIGYGYDDDNEAVDEDTAIEEVLGENPRARDLRMMRLALENRKGMVERERERTTDEREKATLTAKLAELDRQIAAIHKEEAITTFVEDSVRITLHKPTQEELEGF